MSCPPRPSPADLPAGPQSPSLAQAVRFWREPLGFLERCRARYGSRFTLRLPLAPPLVMLSDPAQVREVFTAPPDVLLPGAGTRVLEPVMGSSSVIVLDGAAHLAQRRLLLPAFHGARMARLAGLMGEITEREIAGWPRGTPVQLQPRLQRLTLEVILRAVFGLAPGPRLDALRAPVAAMLEFWDRPISLMLPPDPGGPAAQVLGRAGPAARFRRDLHRVDALIFEVIEARRRGPDAGDGECDVLSMLLAARHEDGRPMSNREVRDELVTLLVAGHETTASALAFALSRLPYHPRVLDRLRDELDAGAGEGYLTATIQEVLRRWPVLPNTALRYVAAPITVGGWDYPAGVCLVPNVYLIHHDPRTYPDPYAFRPERFLDQAPAADTWLPFGGGRRRCLGAGFAMLEMATVLRRVVSVLEVSPTRRRPEPPRRRNVTIRPMGGARVLLRDRPAGADADGAGRRSAPAEVTRYPQSPAVS